MKSFLIVLLCIASSSCFAQYRIREVDTSNQDDQTPGTLSKKDILLVCLISPRQKVQYSIDRNNWSNRFLAYQSKIEISLDDEFAYFFVKVCSNEDQFECINYRLRPGRRYILKRDFNSGKVVIITNRN